jgi:hypothetical protein
MYDITRDVVDKLVEQAEAATATSGDWPSNRCTVLAASRALSLCGSSSRARLARRNCFSVTAGFLSSAATVEVKHAMYTKAARTIRGAKRTDRSKGADWPK